MLDEEAMFGAMATNFWPQREGQEQLPKLMQAQTSLSHGANLKPGIEFSQI